MNRTLLSAVMVFSSTVLAHAQAKVGPGTGIDWQGDWEAAVKEATARNVPIMFTLHKDH